MENFEKVVKLASFKLGNDITINYNNGQFSWSCGAYGQDTNSLTDLEGHETSHVQVMARA